MSTRMFASRGPIGSGAAPAGTESVVEIRKVTGFVPVSREVLEDVPNITRYLYAELDRAMDRVVRPWAYPDKGVRFSLTLFPQWVERLLAKWDAR